MWTAELPKCAVVVLARVLLAEPSSWRSQAAADEPRGGAARMGTAALPRVGAVAQVLLVQMLALPEHQSSMKG